MAQENVVWVLCDKEHEAKDSISELDESAERFPTRVANKTKQKGRDELRNPHGRSLTTQRVSLDTQMLGVDCYAYLS